LARELASIDEQLRHVDEAIRRAEMETQAVIRKADVLVGEEPVGDSSRG
jgi:hypothetical protein